MIVDCALYTRGRREAVPDDLGAALATARATGDSFIWIGLHEPTEAELEKVALEFGLHPLAVEDAVKAHQRPKVEEFADSLFVVLKTVGYDEDTQQVELGDVMLFLGDSFIVSVRHGRARALSDIRRRLEIESDLLECGPAAVLYAVSDAVVDDYSEIAFAVEEDIEEVEERVFSLERNNDAARIYNLKREVIEFRRAVRPLVEPMSRLSTGQVQMVHERLHPFFRDVADHAVRVAEQVDGFDDLLGLGAQRQPGPGRRAAELGHAPHLGLGGDRCGPDGDRRDLRDELRPHARAALDLRLPGRPPADGGHLRRPLPRVQAQWLAVTRSGTGRSHFGPSVQVFPVKTCTRAGPAVTMDLRPRWNDVWGYLGLCTVGA